MTPSDLKYHYQLNNPDGHYFDRKTLKFFGDTMANYKVIDRGHVWELVRKKAVNGALKTSCYFSKISYDSSSNLEYFEGEKQVLESGGYNPFICRDSYSATSFIETDYRLLVTMADGCYECYVYDSIKDGLPDGYWVKTRLGYESMDESQIERMYLC